MEIKIRPRHPEKVNKPANPIKKKPYWIRSKLLSSKEFFLTKTVVNKDNLDLDFIEILIREKFLFGKTGETTYIINNDKKQN